MYSNMNMERLWAPVRRPEFLDDSLTVCLLQHGFTVTLPSMSVHISNVKSWSTDKSEHESKEEMITPRRNCLVLSCER